MTERLTTLADVKENMQEVGDRIRRSMQNISIPVRLYQQHTTGERRSGFYIEQYNLEVFVDWMIRYYTERGLTTTEPYQHLSAFMNAVVQLRDQLNADLERLYLLIDQASLVQERASKEPPEPRPAPQEQPIRVQDIGSIPRAPLLPAPSGPQPDATDDTEEDDGDEPGDDVVDPEEFYT